MPLVNLLDRVPELIVGAVRGGGSSSGNRANISFTRMESISLDERPDSNINNRNSWPDNGSNDNINSGTRRVPTLRNSSLYLNRNRSMQMSPMQRYFPLLCIAQTIVIGIIIVYLCWPRSSSHYQDQPLPITVQPSSLSGSRYRVYTNGSIRARFLLDLASGCNQRKHDLHFGSVKCASNNMQDCETLPVASSQSRYETDDDEERLKIIGDARLVAQIITTSKSGKRLHSKWAMLEEIDDSTTSSNISHLLDCSTKLLVGTFTKQSIIGWGGALTDSSINNILSLSTNGTRQLLDDYFGPNGLQFNIVRISIGGSDFSARFYTNNDKQVPDEPDDLMMNKFRLATEDSLYKIPVLRYIQSKYGGRARQGHDGEIKLLASMWSPPIWMKTNNHFNKGQLKGSISMTTSTNSTDERYYKALAELKKQFLLAYQANSIKFWGLTVMNEPVFAVQPFLDFNTMIFPKHDYASYVSKYLGPALKEHPKLSHIKLIAHDDNRRFLLNFTEPTLNRESSGRYIDGVSVHGYADKDYHQMDAIYRLNRHKDLFVLPTELCSGHLPWMEKALAGNWHRGVHYALDIIHSLQHSAAGWVDWNMALDMEGGPGWLGGRLDSPVLIDKLNDLYHKSPMFYVLGHFSRHIPPGSVRIGTTLINGAYNYPLETVTFRSSIPYEGATQLVTVILNANPHPIKIHLKQYGSYKFLKLECESDSITTIKYKELIGRN